MTLLELYLDYTGAEALLVGSIELLVTMKALMTS